MRDIVVDCTELYVNPTRTGIQRVVREMLRHWPADGPCLHLARFDGHGLLPLSDRVRRILTDDDPACAGLSGAALIGRVQEAAREAEARLMPAAPVLVPEVFYDQARSEFHVRRARTLGLPLAMIAYDFLPFVQPGLFRIRTTSSLMWYVRAVRAAASVAHISEQTRLAYERRIMRGNGAPGPVLPLGADGIAIERQRWRPERRNFVSLGSIDGRKNQQAIVAAFVRLWNEGHDAPLVLIGSVFAHMDDGWLRQALNYPQLRWLDRASDADIVRELRQARATVYASTAEGFGLPPVESLAAGIPVIGSAQIPSLSMLAPGGQRRLDPVSEQTIADAVLALGDDDIAARLWTEAASLLLPTWSAFGRRTAEWLDRL